MKQPPLQHPVLVTSFQHILTYSSLLRFISLFFSKMLLNFAINTDFKNFTRKCIRVFFGFKEAHFRSTFSPSRCKKTQNMHVVSIFKFQPSYSPYGFRMDFLLNNFAWDCQRWLLEPQPHWNLYFEFFSRNKIQWV